ncbi:ABC-2 type transport system permease protein [Abditibacterium utsteinense]|uniref:ABC-2 type transport system permease protein n=1 Tax=Abditibacterium utsteinense TaxID=1960156 RepID=A0A2S8SXK2_9BACT|nr:ABC transporter permease [Abditibacterium utsteinense]PQV65527.1 ABC-2 type transport system permease protein [Abditibacterium utsteinense]
MTTTLHLAWKEIRAYFSSWVAYVLCAGWLFLAGLTFVSLLGANSPGAPFSLAPLYQNLIVVLLFLTPLLTMRLIAEERAQGTFEMLFTSPLTEWQVTLGKWLGALFFCAVLLLLTLQFPFFVASYGAGDAAPTWGAYIALVCLAATFCAFGVFCSSLSESQIVAGFLTFGGLLLSWMLSFFAAVSPESSIATLAGELSVFTHFARMLGGAIDTQDLMFFVSLTGFFLYATTRVLESRKWK